MNPKHTCWADGCENEIDEPKHCCNGHHCGCHGMPVDPPFCSEECLKKWQEQNNKPNQPISLPSKNHENPST